MADTERKQRKSVAFSEGTTIMDENGEISESNHTEDKSTADSHSNRTSFVKSHPSTHPADRPTNAENLLTLLIQHHKTRMLTP